MVETRMDREFVVARLADLIERRALGRVVFASPTGASRVASGDFTISAQPWPRFNVVCSGQKKICLPVGNGSMEFQLSEGDAFCVPPGAWEGHAPAMEYQALCVVPREGFLRVAWHHIDNHHPGGNYSIFHHTNHPCLSALDLAMKTLLGLAGADDDTVVLQGLVVARLALAECRRDPKREKGKALRTFEQMRSWIDFHLDDVVERGETARRFDVSPSYVSQLFRRVTGKGFQTQVTLWRLERAKQMLESTNLSVGVVADQCGFRNASHFGRRFREFNGISPGIFRSVSKQPAMKRRVKVESESVGE